MSHGTALAKDRPSVGRTLQQARIAAKLTVDEVSTSTRVRIPIVHAIEQDDFSRCGGDVYARGHIRTLARAVGLDPADLIEQYRAEQGTAAAPEPTPAAPVFDAERIRPEPRRPNWTAAMVAAIVAVVGFVGFTFFSGAGDEEPATVAEGSQSAESAEDPDEASEAGGGTADPEPEPSDSAIANVPADKVTVTVTANGQSWVSVKDQGTGQLLFEGELNEGDSETFTADDQIDLVTGNAGVIELHVNGKPIEDIGETGQVQRLSFTTGDPEEG
ncbi:DUF4115 domain-containing protein [Streptomyces sp. ACA25]|uniref:helix-turn-helix domain-containing protein n=1 Tax=Streptomyces sp. ACA25 TaxID=3022596 RepID=UPI0023082C9F|nr:helix-turn-helix domain-containing protein [Streptomyces sp. ACA25]MDB1088862.1 DUF4115 domain-containing protein [Streptomyces sp. ACA25]